MYTSDLTIEPAVLVRRNWLSLLNHLYSEGVVSYRSGLENQPTAASDIFLTY